MFNIFDNFQFDYNYIKNLIRHSSFPKLNRSRHQTDFPRYSGGGGGGYGNQYVTPNIGLSSYATSATNPTYKHQQQHPMFTSEFHRLLLNLVFNN
jgi:hypothetical protein